MSKSVDTVDKDVYELLNSDLTHEPDAALAASYAMDIGGELAKSTVKRNRPREKGKLWASDLGKMCMRQHYYNFHPDGNEEKLDGHTKFKFLYGHLLEHSALYLMEEAGHEITNKQAEVEATTNGWTVRGRIDAVVDKTLVDVKSTSSFGYNKMKDGVTNHNDTFGYLYQLGFYHHYNDFTDWNGKSGFILADKGNGHIQYVDSSKDIPTRTALENRIQSIIQAIESPASGHVPKAFTKVPDGKSGNMKLSTQCSYCPHKQRCWADSNGGKGLRGFLYSTGPRWLTDVKNTPRVQEIGN